MRALTLPVCSLLLFTLITVSDAAPPRLVESHGASSSSAATHAVSTQTFTLAQFTFDDALGAPDPQGWTSIDVTAVPEAYFHVDDFLAVGPPYAPLGGSQSLWCGVYCGTGIGCTYATAPGYGDSWLQDFTSDAFPFGGGAVTFSYDVVYDVEAGYDYVRAEYRSKNGNWIPLAEYTGTGTASPSHNIPADSLDTTVQVRLRVETDVSFSDADGNYDSDGAAIFDNLSLSGSGLLEFQDFESETVGATSTLDDSWGAQRSPGFGDFAALFDGVGVLQEDMSYTNTTNLWGFFDGSTDNYSCGGFPSQAVVPFPVGPNPEDFINNEIRSPLLDLATATDGTPLPPADTVAVEFDVYTDLPADNAVFYKVLFRFEEGGIVGRWQNSTTIYFGDFQVWNRPTVQVPVPVGATKVQVALGVVDKCRSLCPGTHSGACHSHGPLLDNIAIRVKGAAITVTNTNDSGAGSLRQAILDANASPGLDFIAFDIPGAGPHVIQPLTNLPTVSDRVVIDGYTQQGASPNTAGPTEAMSTQIMVEVDGALISEDNGLAILTDSSVVRGIAINGFPSYGVAIYGSDCVVEGCFLGTDASGTVDKGNWSGIGCSFGSVGTRIGGDTPAARNLISGNDNSGIRLTAGTNHVVVGNFIGVNMTGTSPLGNLNGIHVAGADASTIGGDTPADRNLISGNTEAGIFFSNSSDNVVVMGNHIGVSRTGISRKGNGTHGVHITASTGTQIGGWNSGEGNLISGNVGNGIFDDATNTVIVGNVIGGDESGTIAVVNEGHGVELATGSAGTVVGQDSLSGGNRIAFNDRDGVESLSSHFVISANDVYFNGFQGIDTGDDGIGTGSPHPSFLPIPTVASAAKPGALTTVTGTVTGPPNSILRLEFFADDVICDISGYGEGRHYLEAATVMTDGSGVAAFSVDVAGANVGDHVTATSTAPDSLTSEFSNCVEVINTPTGSGVEVTLLDAATQKVSASFSTVTTGGNTTLQYTASCDPLPSGFVYGDSLGCFDIQTTATWSGTVEVCVEYDPDHVAEPENGLRLLHYNSSTLMWEDVTASIDTSLNLLCGVSSSLSPFVVAAFDAFTSVPSGATPVRAALRQNIPNPFNPTTTITYDVPAGGGHVRISIYDVAGRFVRTLVDGWHGAGTETVTWDGTDARGNATASGVYFYRMVSGDFLQTRKMVLLK